MASLKEIKSRINSINGTLKITSAMKLVASSKLRKAQTAIGNMVPYEKQMHHILSDLLSDEISSGERFVAVRPVRKVALVAVSSNSSLCGAFNSIVTRHFMETAEEYMKMGLSKEDILVFPVGRKITEAVRKAGFAPQGDFTRLADKPRYADAVSLAGTLMDLFTGRTVDKVELVYNHFRSTASQVPVRETYLPVSLDASSYEDRDNVHDSGQSYCHEYIVEPDPGAVLEELLPKVLNLKIYTMLLDANAAEHAARTVAMQVASDNGKQLLQDITVQYNKKRQQAITDELQDIIGGTMA